MSNSKLLQLARTRSAPGGEGQRWHFDFMGASRWFFTFSGVILIIGAVALSTKELNFGIDFESGTRITAALEKPTNEDEVKRALEEAGVENAEVQQVTVPHFGSNVFQIESAQLQPGEVRETEKALAARRTGSTKKASKAPASGRPSATRWPNRRSRR